MSIETGNEKCIDAFLSRIAEVQKLADKIKSAADDNLGADPDEITWGDVVNAGRLLKDLERSPNTLNRNRKALTKETKHTPGPWTTGNGACHTVIAPKKNGHTRIIAVCPDQQGEIDYNSDEVLANARLISAAPDMFSALKRLSDAAFRRDITMGSQCNLIEVKKELAAADDYARAAIAKVLTHE